MATLVNIVDFIVLLMFVVHIPRVVRKALSQGSGQMLLTLCIAVAVIIFALVSFIAEAGLIASVSSLTQGILLLFLVVMAVLVRASWADNSAV